MDMTSALVSFSNGLILRTHRQDIWYYSFSLTSHLPLQVTVHISDSEDDSEEYITDEEREEGEEGDPEMQAGRSGLSVETGPPTSCIIPTYRWINLRELE